MLGPCWGRAGATLRPRWAHVVRRVLQAALRRRRPRPSTALDTPPRAPRVGSAFAVAGSRLLLRRPALPRAAKDAQRAAAEQEPLAVHDAGPPRFIVLRGVGSLRAAGHSAHRCRCCRCCYSLFSCCCRFRCCCICCSRSGYCCFTVVVAGPASSLKSLAASGSMDAASVRYWQRSRLPSA